jgi:DNA-directed RNA polymerase specialized sigma24 family protein
MPGLIPEERRWELSPGAFRGLLAFLDPEERRAAEQYERVREKLTRFFEWRGCIPGDEYADETIDRVARRIEQGIESIPENPYLYFHGVALNVIRERWRKAARDPQPLPSKDPAVDPFEARHRQEIETENERRIACLHNCLDRLSPVSRELLTTYHLGTERIQIGGRKTLADTLKIPAAALRLRVFRIRRQVHTCVSECLSRGGER